VGRIDGEESALSKGLITRQHAADGRRMSRDMIRKVRRIRAATWATLAALAYGAMVSAAQSGAQAPGCRISGRVTTAAGRGIARAVIAVEEIGGSIVGRAVTNTFGYYTVTDLPSGAAYIVSVGSKRYAFSIDSRVVAVNDNVTGVNFTADP